MKNLDFPTDLKKFNIKFYENPSSGSQVDTIRQTDMTQLKVTFHDCANLPKNAVMSTTQ